MALTKRERRRKIQYKTRKKMGGTTARPRLCVFRSNKYIYAQVIDDTKGHTLASASSREEAVDNSGNKSEVAGRVGKLVGERAVAAGVNTVVFDRSGYLYHGRVKSLADGAREAGLKF